MVPLLPPSTTMKLLVLSCTAVPQAADVIMARGSNNRVTAWPLAPLPWKVKPVAPTAPLIVPQRCTVVPGPICVVPAPQLPAVLKKLVARALAQLEPSPLPDAAWAINTLVAEPKPS